MEVYGPTKQKKNRFFDLTVTSAWFCFNPPIWLPWSSLGTLNSEGLDECSRSPHQLTATSNQLPHLCGYWVTAGVSVIIGRWLIVKQLSVSPSHTSFVCIESSRSVKSREICLSSTAIPTGKTAARTPLNPFLQCKSTSNNGILQNLWPVSYHRQSAIIKGALNEFYWIFFKPKPSS